MKEYKGKYIYIYKNINENIINSARSTLRDTCCPAAAPSSSLRRSTSGGSPELNFHRIETNKGSNCRFFQALQLCKWRHYAIY